MPGSRLIFLLVMVYTLTLGACSKGDDSANDGQTSPSAASESTAKAAQISASSGEALPVAAEMMPYSEAEDGLIRGYFAYPASMVEPLPAVLLIHDWWGLDDVVRAQADALAEQGYVAFAVDLFHGKVASNTTEAAALSRRLLDETELAKANIAAAYRFVTDVAGSPKVAVLGWSMGGQWATQTPAFVDGEVAGVVSYYGQLDEQPDAIAGLSAPLLGLFAENDRSVAPAAVRAYRQAAEEAEKDVDLYIFPRVSSGFANPEDSRYDEAAASEAWQRTLSFLARTLRSRPGS